MDKIKAVFKMLWPDKCRHDFSGFWRVTCKKCGVPKNIFYKPAPNFVTWSIFGLMWEQAQKMEWWIPFLKWVWMHEDQAFLGSMNIGVKFINPVTFLDLLYEFGIASERIKEEKS